MLLHRKISLICTTAVVCLSSMPKLAGNKDGLRNCCPDFSLLLNFGSYAGQMFSPENVYHGFKFMDFSAFSPLTHAGKIYTSCILFWAAIFEDTVSFFIFFHECPLCWMKVLSILIKTTDQFTILSVIWVKTKLLSIPNQHFTCWWKRGEGHFRIPWFEWSISGVKKFGDDHGKRIDELLREMATQYWEKENMRKELKTYQIKGKEKPWESFKIALLCPTRISSTLISLQSLFSNLAYPLRRGLKKEKWFYHSYHFTD